MYGNGGASRQEPAPISARHKSFQGFKLEYAFLGNAFELKLGDGRIPGCFQQRYEADRLNVLFAGRF